MEYGADELENSTRLSSTEGGAPIPKAAGFPVFSLII